MTTQHQTSLADAAGSHPAPAPPSTPDGRTPSPDGTTPAPLLTDARGTDAADGAAVAPRTRAEARALRETTTHGPSGDDAAAGSTARVEWVDVARAMTVLAVVTFHVGFVHYQPLVDGHTNVMTKAWNRFGEMLALFRMPLLLMLSGLLATTRVRSGLSARTVTGFVRNYYLYLVWLLVYVVAVPPTTEYRVTGVKDLVGQLVVPETTLWFVWLLAVGVLGLAATRRLPRGVVIGALIVLEVLVEIATARGTHLPLGIRVLPLVVYLAAGVELRDWLREHVAERRTLLGAAVGFVGCFLAYLALPAVLHLPLWPLAPLRVATGLLAAVTLMSAVAHATRWRAFARVGAWVGQRTLGIYVIHFPLVAWLAAAPPGVRERLGSALSANLALAAVYPVVVTLLVTAASLGIEQGLKRVGGGWLFSMPQRLAEPFARLAR